MHRRNNDRHTRARKGIFKKLRFLTNVRSVCERRLYLCMTTTHRRRRTAPTVCLSWWCSTMRRARRLGCGSSCGCLRLWQPHHCSLSKTHRPPPPLCLATKRGRCTRTWCWLHCRDNQSRPPRQNILDLCKPTNVVKGLVKRRGFGARVSCHERTFCCCP